MSRIAVYTFGILREAPGHPQVQGFIDRDPQVLAAAGHSEGFIARSGYEGDPGPPSWGAQDYPRFFPGRNDEWTPVTLSLWQDLESLMAFVYSGWHAEALGHAREWLIQPEWPSHALWWVEDEIRPEWREAKTRHEYLHDHGPGPYAFNFRNPYDPQGQKTRLDNARVKAIARRNNDQ